MIKLNPKDKVGIASPAGFINSLDDIAPALAYLRSLGLESVIGNHVLDKYFYMGGTDADRAADLNAFFADDSIKAIFTTAGGAGAQRILPFLDYDLIKKHPKPIFGLSDNTSLQNGIYAQTGCPSVTGFSLKYDFKNGHFSDFTKASLEAVFKGEKQKIQSGKTLSSGTAEGILIGSCLSTFRNLCGTPFMPELKDKILLLEDVGEKSYKIGVMLSQLLQQKDFENLRGIIFGQFTNCAPFEEQDGTVEEMLQEFPSLLKKQIPIITDFQFGHIPDRYVLPLGEKVCLNADNCLLEYI